MFSKINFIEQYKSIFYLPPSTSLYSHPEHHFYCPAPPFKSNLPTNYKNTHFLKKFNPVYPFHHEFPPKYEKLNIWDEEKEER